MLNIECFLCEPLCFLCGMYYYLKNREAESKPVFIYQLSIKAL